MVIGSDIVHGNKPELRVVRVRFGPPSRQIGCTLENIYPWNPLATKKLKMLQRAVENSTLWILWIIVEGLRLVRCARWAPVALPVRWALVSELLSIQPSPRPTFVPVKVAVARLGIKLQVVLANMNFISQICRLYVHSRGGTPLKQSLDMAGRSGTQHEHC